MPNPKGDLCIGKFKFSSIQIVNNILFNIPFQILTNVIWEYMTVVGMLFALTPLEGSTVLVKATSLGTEDPV